MKNALASIVALTAACYGFAAQAADDAASAPLTKQEAKDLKTQSDAAYKAHKNVAEANHDLNKGDCKTGSPSGSTERACKKEARAIEKQEKADAKTQHESEKDAIKANSK